VGRPLWRQDGSVFYICKMNSESESHVTTDGQPASLSWNKAPFWGLRPDLYYCLTVVGLLIWGALSDERTDLSFVIATGPRQGSHFLIRVPWNSLPYFTLSDLRLPFSSPPTTRRVTAEVFDPASTRVGCKRPSLFLVNVRHGPRTENTLRTQYPSNSSIVIETAVLLLPALSRECV
jgi:hypothetical protein